MFSLLVNTRPEDLGCLVTDLLGGVGVTKSLKLVALRSNIEHVLSSAVRSNDKSCRDDSEYECCLTRLQSREESSKKQAPNLIGVETFCGELAGERPKCKGSYRGRAGLYMGMYFSPEIRGSASGLKELTSASLLKGYTPHTLNPAITFFMVIALVHAWENKEQKS